MNIFVAKLDFKTTDGTLRTLFEQFGTVESATIVCSRDSGKSRGYAFGEMLDEKEATNGVNMLDGTILDGREIVVQKNKQKPGLSNNLHQTRR